MFGTILKRRTLIVVIRFTRFGILEAHYSEVGFGFHFIIYIVLEYIGYFDQGFGLSLTLLPYQ
jgi:hypothetical protein